MLHDPIAIARACYEAYISKDRAAIEALLAPDFHFTSPFDNHIDRTTYFKRCWPLSEIVKSYDFIRLAFDGANVYVTYEGQTVDGERFRNTEIMTILDGRITDVEVYFGWDVPHPAAKGGFIDPDEDD
jgi:ketosteroid isomerase-like protein